MRAILKSAFVLMIAAAFASAAQAQTQVSASLDGSISQICQDYFPKGARYAGVMQIKYGGDGKLVPADVAMDVNSCGRSQFSSGEPAIKIDVDATTNGKTRPGVSWYFGVQGLTLRWTALSSYTGTLRRVVITLNPDKASYVEERTFTTYSNSTTMTRVPR